MGNEWDRGVLCSVCCLKISWVRSGGNFQSSGWVDNLDPLSARCMYGMYIDRKQEREKQGGSSETSQNKSQAKIEIKE